MALILYRPAFWLLAVVGAAALSWLARRVGLRWRPALFLRIAVFVGLLVALFFPGAEVLRQPMPERTIMVLDASASVPEEQRAVALQEAIAWSQAAPGRIVIPFGVETRADPDSQFPLRPWRGVHDVEAALDEALSLLDGDPARLVLVTDGAVRGPHAVGERLRRAESMGVGVDVIPLGTHSPAGDAYVRQLAAPSVVWRGLPFNVVASVYMPSAGSARVEFRQSGRVVSEGVQPMQAGVNFVSFEAEATETEAITLEARVDVEGDPKPENDWGFGAARVFDPPPVLIVTRKPDAAARLAAALGEAGINAQIAGPDDLSLDPGDLTGYAAIFVHDLVASAFTDAQQQALSWYASRLGGTLIFLGGRSSYSLGGYENTLLEPILPVSLEPPPRNQKAPLVFLLVMDRSSSMNVSSGTRPIVLAKEAALRALERLEPMDVLGLLTFSTDWEWAVPLDEVGEGISLRSAQDLVSAIDAGGSTNMYAAMQEAVAALKSEARLETRHMLVLSDGKSGDGSDEEFIALADEARRSGITISTIALGARSDAVLMAEIAEHGGGRLFEVPSPEDLPRIMIAETGAARADKLQLGRTSVELGASHHPVMFGLSEASLPDLEGYVALTGRSEQGAEDILVTAGFGDPLLSVWNVGLGRVAAWMGDLGEEWAAEWVEWSEYGRFWAQMLRYTTADPGVQGRRFEVRRADHAVELTLQAEDELRQPANFLDASLAFETRDGDRFEAPLPQTAPGIYVNRLAGLPAGAYRAEAVIANGPEVERIPAPFSFDTDPELVPFEPSQAEQNLNDWAAIGRGEVIGFEDLVEADRPSPLRDRTRDFGDLLLIALAATWPLEIAIRRRWMPWQGT